ncbi:MAG: hypothetical protein ACOYYS_00310 [Chloroflexota bacterium]
MKKSARIGNWALSIVLLLTAGLTNCTRGPALSVTSSALPTEKETTQTSAIHVTPYLSEDESTWIALVSSQPGGETIYLARPDGSQIIPLVAGSQPAWSPDGTQLAFVSWDQGTQKIFVIHVDGTGKTRLTDLPETAREQNPAWSPDGTQIAFEVHTTLPDEEMMQRSDIYIEALTGGKLRRLTDDTTLHTLYPAWSPDGSTFAVVALQGATAELYCMNADGTERRQLTSLNGGVWHPAWSPDGTQIAFGAEPPGEAGHSSIYLIQADGSNLIRLTNDPARNDWEPTWSPSAKYIAYDATGASGTRIGQFDVFVMAIDGSTTWSLTIPPLPNSYDPDW